ncbi:MAG: response regulator [bacterium]
MSVEMRVQELLIGGAPASVLNRQRVLVVDDDPAVQRVLQRTIGRMDLDVRICEDGDEALALVRSQLQPFGLAILDRNIPGTRGAQLVNALRALSPGIRIMMISGDDAIVEEAELLECGVEGLLIKPFELSEIRSRIMRLLDCPDIC